jgi:hypothetical protein
MIVDELFKPDLSVVGRMRRDTEASRRRVASIVRTLVLLISLPAGAAAGGTTFARFEHGNWERATAQIVGAFGYSALVIGLGSLMGGSLLIKVLIMDEVRAQAFQAAASEHAALPSALGLVLLGTGAASVLGATYGWKATLEFSTPRAVFAALGACAFLSAAWIALLRRKSERTS